MNEIVGAVFPFSHETIERMLSGEKSVIAKYVKFQFLYKGKKIIFYDTSTQSLAGEATIKEIDVDDPLKIWEKYGGKIQLNKSEFDSYRVGTRLGPRPKKDRCMSAYVIEKPIKYATTVKPERKMNMIGYYV